jgi:addiction module HigA family antidote
MIPENRIPTHPGEILSEEFLEPTGTTREELSMRIGVPVQHVHEIADGERAITPDIAMLLSQALDTSPDFWLDLQNAHDLALSDRSTGRLEQLGVAESTGNYRE